MFNGRFVLSEFEDRSSAVKAAKQEGVAALTVGGGKPKWLIFMCPCGCGRQTSLNLMERYTPKWTVTRESDGSFNLHPSVNNLVCMAHYWIKNSTVEWC